MAVGRSRTGVATAGLLVRWAAIAVATVLVGTSCSALGVGASDEQAEAGSVRATAAAFQQCLSSRDPSEPARVVVWMRPGAPASTIDGMTAFIDSIPTVEAVHYVDQEETAAELAAFWEDEPELVDLVEPDQLPTSFEIDFASFTVAEAAAAEVRASGMADSVEVGPLEGSCVEEAAALQTACSEGALLDDQDRRLVVWLEPGVDPGVAESVSTLLEASPTVEEVTYLDEDATWADFQANWQNDEEVLSIVDPTQLPTSFRVVTGAGVSVEQIDRLQADLEALPGVSEAETPFGAAVSLCERVG